MQGKGKRRQDKHDVLGGSSFRSVIFCFLIREIQKGIKKIEGRKSILASGNDGGGIFHEAVFVLNVFKHRCLTIDQFGVGL